MKIEAGMMIQIMVAGVRLLVSSGATKKGCLLGDNTELLEEMIEKDPQLGDMTLSALFEATGAETDQKKTVVMKMIQNMWLVNMFWIIFSSLKKLGLNTIDDQFALIGRIRDIHLSSRSETIQAICKVSPEASVDAKVLVDLLCEVMDDSELSLFIRQNWNDITKE